MCKRLKHSLKLLALASLTLALPVFAQQATVELRSKVTGNQEQPKVLYIVPWQSPGSSDDLKQPFESRLGSVFNHLERSEMRRWLSPRMMSNSAAATAR